MPVTCFKVRTSATKFCTFKSEVEALGSTVVISSFSHASSYRLCTHSCWGIFNKICWNKLYLSKVLCVQDSVMIAYWLMLSCYKVSQHHLFNHILQTFGALLQQHYVTYPYVCKSLKLPFEILVQTIIHNLPISFYFSSYYWKSDIHNTHC